MQLITANSITFPQEQVMCLPEMRQLPAECYPMPVVCYDVQALFTFLVAKRTKGDYAHFMWLIGPDELASQGWHFETKKLEDYSSYLLKCWYNPFWTPEQRAAVIASIRKDLAKPTWQTRYDVWALIGHLAGLKWIQSGRFEICSDSADHLLHAGEPYNLVDPNPSQVNAWFKLYPQKWFVRCRYMAGD